MIGEVLRRKIAVEEYYKMAEVGIIKPTERVELINGEIIQMSPIKSKHSGHVNLVCDLLQELLWRKVVIGNQNPIRLNNNSEPEPDISILHRKEKDKFYTKNHPTPQDVYWLIEVSDSTLGYGKKEKVTLYATAVIPEYWIINLVDNQMEVFKNPKDGQYTTKAILKLKDKISLPHFGIEVKVSDFFD